MVADRCHKKNNMNTNINLKFKQKYKMILKLIDLKMKTK